jgi:hypothetical protein
MNVVLALFGWIFEIVIPVTIIRGWVRWAKFGTTRLTDIGSLAPLLSLTLASASAALAISSALYAHFRPFVITTLFLMKIFALGGLLSLTSVAVGLGGVWRKNPLRWHAPVSGIGTLIFWFASAMGE